MFSPLQFSQRRDMETHHIHSMDTHKHTHTHFTGIHCFRVSTLFGLLDDILLFKGVPPAYLQDEAEVGGECLHTVEAGDQSDGQEAFLVHLPPQEEVPLQVVQAEVVLAGTRRKSTRLGDYNGM